MATRPGPTTPKGFDSWTATVVSVDGTTAGVAIVTGQSKDVRYFSTDGTLRSLVQQVRGVVTTMDAPPVVEFSRGTVLDLKAFPPDGPRTPTNEELAQAEWLANYGELNRLTRGVAIRVIALDDPRLTDLADAVRRGFIPAYEAFL
jgi:hypothetical protein